MVRSRAAYCMLSTSRPGTSRSSTITPGGGGGFQRPPTSGVRLGVKTGTTTNVSEVAPTVARTATDHTAIFSVSSTSM